MFMSSLMIKHMKIVYINKYSIYTSFVFIVLCVYIIIWKIQLFFFLPAKFSEKCVKFISIPFVFEIDFNLPGIQSEKIHMLIMYNGLYWTLVYVVPLTSRVIQRRHFLLKVLFTNCDFNLVRKAPYITCHCG